MKYAYSREFKINQEFEILCPFSYRFKSNDFDNLFDTSKSTELDLSHGPYIGLHAEPYTAHAEGKLKLIIKGIYKIDGYPTRIFFIKQYYNTKGDLIDYQINKLHIKSIGAFRNLIKGWRVRYTVRKIT